LAAYFYARHVDIKRAELPFFFITGDEFMYSSVSSKQVKKIFGKQILYWNTSSSSIWKELLAKYNVFYLNKPLGSNDQ
jgi:hypothetical protein